MPDPFEMSSIGDTGVSVSRLGLGTGPLGGWPVAISDSVGISTIRRAWDLGIRYFDTAPLYGHGKSERLLGAALKDIEPRPTVSTKVGKLLVDGEPSSSLYAGADSMTPVEDFSKAGAVRSIEESSRRIGTTHVDISFIHDPDDHIERAAHEVFPALVELKQRGAIGAIGAGMTSNIPLARLAEIVDFDCVLLAGRYTLLDHSEALRTSLRIAEIKQIPIILGGVFNSGVLVDPAPDSYFDYERVSSRVLSKARRLATVCREFDVPVRAAALQFAFAHPLVASVLVGATDPMQVDDLIAMSRYPISSDLWLELKSLDLVDHGAPTP